MAAHLHDSVLQTLTLMQKRSSDPREVAALARRQERELREWLADEGGGADDGTDRGFAAALGAAAAEVEDAHRVAIEVVAVGDCPLDERAGAVVAAAREALTNAAKFAPDGAISVYAEVTPQRIEAYVRDRGPGFDPRDDRRRSPRHQRVDRRADAPPRRQCDDQRRARDRNRDRPCARSEAPGERAADAS